jgi:uncharacterized protein YggE
MKYCFVFAASLAVVIVGALFLQGQPALPEKQPGKEKRTLTVVGSATVAGKIDMARVYVGVRTHAKTVDNARQENLRAVSKVREAILALNIKNLRTRTTDTRVHIERDREQAVVGYSVSHSFTVLVKDSDVEKLGSTAGKILDVALKNGVNMEGEIEFFMENDAEVKREAMTKAVQNALANAKALAAGAEVKIADVTEIGSTSNDYFSYNRTSIQNAAFIDRDASAVTAGELRVSQSVRIVCTY